MRLLSSSFHFVDGAQSQFIRVSCALAMSAKLAEDFGVGWRHILDIVPVISNRGYFRGYEGISARWVVHNDTHASIASENSKSRPPPRVHGIRNMTPELNTILRPSPNVRAITTPDGAALLDIHEGICYSLNPIGATIWEQIQLNSSGIAIEAILQQLEQTCSVNRQEIQEDIIAYVHSLEQRHLVTSSQNGAGRHK